MTALNSTRQKNPTVEYLAFAHYTPGMKMPQTNATHMRHSACMDPAAFPPQQSVNPS